MFSYTSRSLIGVSKRLRAPVPFRPLSSPSQPTPPEQEKTPVQDPTPTPAPVASAKATPVAPTPAATPIATPAATPAATAPASTAPVTPTEAEKITKPSVKEWSERLGAFGEESRLPRSVQAIYLRPLRRKVEYGLPVCDLQLRSYSVRNVEFFTDFAIRAAYYLNLPVSGPVPLPRIVERWTVPRSNFVHKKSQENFERITLRRLIQIKDGNPQAVQAWLAFLRKHAFYGVGMKANIWEHDSLDAGKAMDASVAEVEEALRPEFAQFGQRKDNSAPGTIFDTLNNYDAQVQFYADTLVIGDYGNAKWLHLNFSILALIECLSEMSANAMRPEFASLGTLRAKYLHIRPSGLSLLPKRCHRWNSSKTTPAQEPIIFSGIQPTGVPHLGNYLGALHQWVKLQHDAAEGTKLLFSIVDLHALTVPQDPAQLKRWKKEAFATLLAVGLDPKRSTIFYQSDVPAHTELMWILSTVASMGYLSRMTQWKSKLQLPDDATLDDSTARAQLRLGLFSYPVLQAADILVHRATHVPVGEDQRQHLEFSRYTANSFNHVYGPIFPIPEALISPAKRVMSLKEPTSKMSKSHADEKSRIILTDSPAEIRKKVKVALTDSESSITYDPTRRPGVSNLIEILSHLEGVSCEDIAADFHNASLRSLKEHVADRIAYHLQEIRDRYITIMEDKTGYLESVAEEGAAAARANSRVTMQQIRDAIGLTMGAEVESTASSLHYETLYFCNVTLGTPKQSVRLVLDTGSSDLWTNTPNSTLCASTKNVCAEAGTYDPSSSSSYSFVNSDFNISYADGSGAAGDYVTDTLTIGGTTIKDFQFGVGFSSGSSEGVLGIGYTTNEVQVGRNGDSAYANLPKAMVNKGVIQSNAYSLWLNDLDANTGSILFGGVNSKKYHGALQTVPVQKVGGQYSEFIIALTKVSLTNSSSENTYSSSSIPAGVLLDSGSSLTYLPDALVQEIYDDLGVSYESDSGIGYVECSMADEDITLSYTFSSPTINVGINEMIIDAGDLYFRNGKRACIFGIVPAGSSTAVLGDTFLRSAYVVYDLANNEISLASTNFNTTENDILEIGTGTDSVPGATAVSNPVTTAPVGGTAARIGGPAGGSSLYGSASATGNMAIPRATAMPKHLAVGLAGVGALLAL
ncbi:Ribosomal protein S10 [Penicillium expansum]|uniref:Probable aspartic-type endopeptidase OPSB n=1 Tax=Penicillium expansum TaxID=27334 RepID=A0A0A2K473_PENEN|nr:Ribosomal protein S10 [Penicillium expansum]KGO59225.1 Ribosomal protein S10 [Penicillium expansum]